MGIRLVESVRLSCSGANPRWGRGAATAAVLFDGEFFAVCCRPADCQPDGPHFDLDWSDLCEGALFPTELTQWSSTELLPNCAELACDGYIAEPVAG